MRELPQSLAAHAAKEKFAATNCARVPTVFDPRYFVHTKAAREGIWGKMEATAHLHLHSQEMENCEKG